MSRAPRPRDSILELRPYVQGKSTLPGVQRTIKLSSNESAFGPSPRAIDAYHEAAAQLHRYPDGGQRQLREAIAATHQLHPDNVICGNGSEEIIGLLIRAYAGAGDEIVLSQNHFMMCPIYGRTQDARIVTAPESNDRVDVDALLACVTPRTRLVIVANPNNPTGTYLPGTEIRRLHQGLPGQVLLILDGAYAEYVLESDYEDGAHLVETGQNVVMTRSFSKIHGLAGLRIGWAYAPAHVIDVVQRIRTPFNANRAAMAAASAAVSDTEFVARVRAETAAAQQTIRERLERLGLRVVPSVTNFYLVDFDGAPGCSATEARAYLEARGIIPRPVRAGRGDNSLRVTVGTAEENVAALDVLSEYVASRTISERAS
jgi:histidinol-phosphate aminotransferase